MIVTVLKYDKEKDLYHWNGCLVNMTDAVSRLTLVSYIFDEKLSKFRVYTRSVEWSLFLIMFTVQKYDKEKNL